MKKITEIQFKQNIDAVVEQATDEPIQIETANNTLYLSTIRNINIIDNEWVKEFTAVYLKVFQKKSFLKDILSSEIKN